MTAKPFTIMKANWLAPDIKEFWVSAPRVARKQHAGQFVIVRLHDHGERIPLTIADACPQGGMIRLIVQGVGKTTRLMNSLEAGDAILDLVGPLGNPSAVRRHGTVAVIAGGVGAAIALPVARAMKSAGNRVCGILGAGSDSRLILETELRATSDVMLVMTEDGTCGQRGLVTDALDELMRSESLDMVFAVGPIGMMRAVADATRRDGIPTTASLNPIMVDGTGMCGGCRVLIAGEPRFACVDGPEFDAHKVDFESLRERNSAYQTQEAAALGRFDQDPVNDLRRAHDVCRLQLDDAGQNAPPAPSERSH